MVKAGNVTLLIEEKIISGVVIFIVKGDVGSFIASVVLD